MSYNYYTVNEKERNVMTEYETLIEKIKEQIDPLFEDEDGRELLEDLQEYILTNLS